MASIHSVFYLQELWQWTKDKKKSSYFSIPMVKKESWNHIDDKFIDQCWMVQFKYQESKSSICNLDAYDADINVTTIPS